MRHRWNGTCAVTLLVVVALARTSHGSVAPADPLGPCAGDSDCDSIRDADEGDAARDSDSDRNADRWDEDSDEDGVADRIEAGDGDPDTAPIDSDRDGAPDAYDRDSDDDGVLDAVEDPNGDGFQSTGETARTDPDSDHDGLRDGDEDRNGDGYRSSDETDALDRDTDGDEFPDLLDPCPLHAENDDFRDRWTIDGCPNTPPMPEYSYDPVRYDECPGELEDFDGVADQDGCPDPDSDQDGIDDIVELASECLDWQLADTDGDGLIDGREDLNKNGTRDLGELPACVPGYHARGGGGCAVGAGAGTAGSSRTAATLMLVAAALFLISRRRRA